MNYEIRTWDEISNLSLHWINLIILLITKINCYPLITDFDRVFYTCITLSIPSFYLLCINIYYKIFESNEYHLDAKWEKGRLFIEKEAFKSIKKRNILQQRIFIKIDKSCLNSENIQYLDSNLKILHKLIK